jgi:hypothetical protein
MGVGAQGGQLKKEEADSLQANTGCMCLTILSTSCFFLSNVLCTVDQKELRLLNKQFKKEAPAGHIGKPELKVRDIPSRLGQACVLMAETTFLCRR